MMLLHQHFNRINGTYKGDLNILVGRRTSLLFTSSRISPRKVQEKEIHHIQLKCFFSTTIEQISPQLGLRV